MKSVKVVAAVIKSLDDQGNEMILATQRGYGEFEGLWEFPGGKIEAGETSVDALKREIKEELGVDIEVLDYIKTIEYDYASFHLSMECFWCKIMEGVIELREAKAAEWLKLEDLRRLKWLPADILVVEEMIK